MYIYQTKQKKQNKTGQSDTQTQAKTRIEGRYINLSLHYLEQVRARLVVGCIYVHAFVGR